MDLTRFLACEYDPREYLQHPMRMNGGIAAANGHVLIILHDHNPSITARPAPSTVEKKVLEYLDICRTSEPVAVSSIDLGDPTKCPQCDGKGTMFEQHCSQCDGKGYAVLPDDRTASCQRCNAIGAELNREPTSSESTQVTCPTCEGFGTAYETRAVNGVLFQRKYLALIAALPDCQLKVASTCEPALFTFTGGLGLLMPCRSSDENGETALH